MKNSRFDPEIITQHKHNGMPKGVEDPTMEKVVAMAPFYGDPSDDRGLLEKGSNVELIIPDDYR